MRAGSRPNVAKLQWEHTQNIFDLCICLLMAVTFTVKLCNIHLPGTLGYWPCMILVSESLLWASVSGAQINLMSVTIERYLKVVHHKATWSKKNCCASGSKSRQRQSHGSAVLHTTWLWSIGRATWWMESAIFIRSGAAPSPHLHMASGTSPFSFSLSFSSSVSATVASWSSFVVRLASWPVTVDLDQVPLRTTSTRFNPTWSRRRWRWSP